jgi:hypothetical protein
MGGYYLGSNISAYTDCHRGIVAWGSSDGALPVGTTGIIIKRVAGNVSHQGGYNERDNLEVAPSLQIFIAPSYVGTHVADNNLQQAIFLTTI